MNNNLILNNLNDENIQNVQKLIFENEKKIKSRDIDSLVKIFTSNSNFDELNEFDHVTSRNSLFETIISLIDDFNENELILIAKNINFDFVIYYEIKASFDSIE